MREQGRLEPEIYPWHRQIHCFLHFLSRCFELYSEVFLQVSCLKPASSWSFGQDIIRSPRYPCHTDTHRYWHIQTHTERHTCTHARTSYPHVMIICFSCCKSGWFATPREQLPWALRLWPLAMFTGRCVTRRRNGFLPSCGPRLLLRSSPRATPTWLSKRVQNSLMWGWGGGQWGIDGWLCFFICAIVWTILKLHVNGKFSIWLVDEKWNHSNICFSINFFLYKY